MRGSCEISNAKLGLRGAFLASEALRDSVRTYACHHNTGGLENGQEANQIMNSRRKQLYLETHNYYTRKEVCQRLEGGCEHQAGVSIEQV